LNSFGDLQAAYLGAGAEAPTRAGLRTSAHWKALAAPVALKRNLTLWCLELTDTVSSRVFGAAAAGGWELWSLPAAAWTTAVALELALVPAPAASAAVSATRIVAPRSAEPSV
jgi:TRAP-type C4-dicarboxylate transport system permease small subunit